MSSEIGSGYSGGDYTQADYYNASAVPAHNVPDVDKPSSSKTIASADKVNDLAAELVAALAILGTSVQGNETSLSVRLGKILGGDEVYLVKKIEITGTAASPQTLTYASLTDAHGGTIKTTFTTPAVTVVGTYQDRGAYKTEDESTTYCKMAKNQYGVGSDVYVDLLIMECG